MLTSAKTHRKGHIQPSACGYKPAQELAADRIKTQDFTSDVLEVCVDSYIRDVKVSIGSNRYPSGQNQPCGSVGNYSGDKAPVLQKLLDLASQCGWIDGVDIEAFRRRRHTSRIARPRIPSS